MLYQSMVSNDADEVAILRTKKKYKMKKKLLKKTKKIKKKTIMK